MTEAEVAAAVHTAAGRDDLAREARQVIAAATGGRQADLEYLIEAVRGDGTTLASVLHSLDRAELADTLTAPPTATRIMVPAMRCPPQEAPA